MTPFAGHLASRKLLHMDVLSSIAMGLAIKMKNRPNPIHRSELWSHRQEVLDNADDELQPKGIHRQMAIYG
jgi:hypothetical protein